jgi:hypothetical protein
MRGAPQDTQQSFVDLKGLLHRLLNSVPVTVPGLAQNGAHILL